ncbi:MAG: DUF3833 family protein [Paracoccaceae bacterium]|nr:DUF3833 family protein [Paracoccaceae bacterium]
MMWVIFMLTVFCLLFITVKSHFFAFKSQNILRFKEEKNIFDIRDCLNGHMLAEGMVYGLSGNLESTFIATFEGSWEGNEGTLIESFSFSSGKNQNRRWKLKVLDDGTIEGTAPDIIGKANGQQMGSAVKLEYKIKLSQELGGHSINVIDWMHLMENGTIINRSEFRKFGMKVGELVATFRTKQ